MDALDSQGTLPRRGVLRPAPPAPSAPPRARVVGPGRREREYLERVSELERRVAGAERELEVSSRVERGARRYVDKVEERLDRAREAAERHQQAQKRLAVALGALQRENELLRARLAALPEASTPEPRRLAERRKASAGSRPVWLARWLGSRATRGTRA